MRLIAPDYLSDIGNYFASLRRLSAIGLAFALALCAASANSQVSAQDKTSSTKGLESPQEIRQVLSSPIRDKWALVVGISKFKEKSVPRLRYATKDAKDFYKYLIKEANFKPDHVRLLLNEKATRRRVMSELGSKFLARLANKEDLVVLFFSTHGSPSQMDLRGVNYLVAYDSDPKDLFATGIEMKDVLESIDSRVFTDRVLLVLDACHSGALKPGAKGLQRVGNFDAGALAQGSGQMVVCSSQTDQQSWESRRYKNGVFTKQLLDGLRKEGSKTVLKDAFNNLKESVSQEVKVDRNARQTPVMHTKWDGEDLVIAAKPTAPREIPETVIDQLEPDSAEDVYEEEQPVRRGVVRQEAPAEEEYYEEEAAEEEPAAEGEPVEEQVVEEQTPSSPDKLVLTIDYFAEEGDPKQLLHSYNATIRENPRDPVMFYKRACVYMRLKKWVRAHNDLSHAQRVDPNSPAIYIGLAYVYHKRKDPVSAARSIEQALFLNPTLPEGEKLPQQIEFGD